MDVYESFDPAVCSYGSPLRVARLVRLPLRPSRSRGAADACGNHERLRAERMHTGTGRAGDLAAGKSLRHRHPGREGLVHGER